MDTIETMNAAEATEWLRARGMRISPQMLVRGQPRVKLAREVEKDFRLIRRNSDCLRADIEPLQMRRYAHVCL